MGPGGIEADQSMTDTLKAVVSDGGDVRHDQDIDVVVEEIVGAVFMFSGKESDPPPRGPNGVSEWFQDPLKQVRVDHRFGLQETEECWEPNMKELLLQLENAG